MRIAYRLAGNQDDAEDLVQEVCIQHLTHWEQLEDADHIEQWLRHILLNAYRDLWRYRNYRPEMLASEMGEPGWQRVQEQQAGEERHQAEQQFFDSLIIRQAGDKLSAREWQLMVWKYGMGWSYAEIASHLKMTETAVEKGIYRARQRFKKVYKHLIQEEI
ncbi:MAG: sigma-70 family RNA polymerase sigma factor [Armatimonadetes bacterium]|nr:sigma-70 family RNA polymerase sigma factor [Armatimonadota bacterium]